MPSGLIVHGYEACNVGELIEHLAKIPPETPVVYQCMSDHSPLQLSEIEYAEKKDTVFFHYNGGVLKPSKYQRLDGLDVPISVVVFPGN